MSNRKKKWSELTFKEKRNFYLGGTLIFLSFICFTFIMTPSPNLKDLTKLELTLLKDPNFKRSNGKSSSYWVELYTNKGKYKINGIDYKYLKIKAFKKSIRKGVKLEVKAKNEKIYALTYKSVDYLRYFEAQVHKSKNRTFSRILFGSGFVVFLISYLFKHELRFNYYGIKTVIDFGPIILIVLIISFIFGLIIIGGSDYISGQEFIYK